MVGNVQSGHCVPRKELLGHPRVVHLVNHDIKSVYLSKSIHFKLTTPSGILTDPTYVVIDTLIIFNKELVQFFVFFDVICTLRPILSMMSLVAFKLVTQSSKETVSICIDFL